MPAVGFALIMSTIGKPKLIPFTVVGFILVKAMGLNNLVTGAFILCVALIMVFKEKEFDEKMEMKNA